MKHLIPIVLILSSVYSFGQQHKALIPFLKKNNKYIYVDSISMKPVLNQEWDNARPFNKSYAIVTKSFKTGVIDSVGNVVIPIKYDFCDFANKQRFVQAQLAGKYGMIDILSGKILMPFVYDYIGGTINSSDTFAVEVNGKWGFIDSTQKYIIPLEYDNCYDFYNGIAMVKQNGKWFLIDSKNNTVTQTKYDDVGFFSKGYASVMVNHKWGVITINNNTVIPFKYDAINTILGDSLLSAQLAGKWGFVDLTGKEVIPFTYSVAGFFFQGLAPVEINQQFGFIDKLGKVVIPLMYDATVPPFTDGLVAVELKNQWGFINSSNTTIIPFIYTQASAFENGLALCQVNNGVRPFYIDEVGRGFYEK